MTTPTFPRCRPFRPLLTRGAVPLLGLCLLPAALAPTALPTDGVLVRHPAPGSELTRRFESTFALSFVELTSTLGGVEVPSEYLPRMEIESLRHQVLEVTETLDSAAEGAPLGWTRTYDVIEARRRDDVTVEGYVEDSSDIEGDSLLTGRTVRFERRGEDVRRSFEGDDEPPFDLAGLRASLDLAELVEDSTLSPDRSWSVPVDVLADLLTPGGDLALAFEGVSAETLARETSSVDWEGTAKVRFAELRRDGGVAAFELSGTLESELEFVTDLANIPVADGTGTETIGTRIEFTGRFEWDLEAGHLLELELHGPVRVETRIEKDPGQDGPDFTSTVALAGTWDVTVAVN